MKLQTRILCLGLALAVISGGLTLGIATRVFDSILVGQVIQLGTLEASKLAERASDGIVGGKEAALLFELQAAQHATDASAAIALDASGNVLADTDITMKGQRYAHAFAAEISASSETVATRSGTMLRVGTPVWESAAADLGEQLLMAGAPSENTKSRIGSVVLEIPLTKTLAVSRRIVRQLALIICVIGLAAIISSVLVVRGILRPVSQLISGTERIARGDYGSQIQVSRADEVGQLAGAFNRMSQVLAETTVSKKFMHGVFSNMTEPLFVIGVDGKIQVCNEAALALIGYDRSELIGQPLLTFVVPEEGTPARDPMDIVKNAEATLGTKQGSRVDVLYSTSQLKDAEGKSQGVILVARDMTERKTMETIIRRSEKMSAVGQLAAGVAHEINNPLGVILGYAQALTRRLASPEDPSAVPLKSIEKEALRCKGLVQDLLTFSRVSKVEKEPSDLNKIVTAALSLVSAQARMGQVTVESHLTDGLPLFLGNPNQIQQIIINLATNAIDAMQNNGTLTIATNLQTDGPLTWVCLRVRDTGSGIPPDLLSKIFEPFFTTKPVGKGTGLGLSLVHEIIGKHSGTINVESRPGSTEFTVKFPVRFADVPRQVAKV